MRPDGCPSDGSALKAASASVLGGIFFVVLACACFTVLDTTAKYVALSVPILMAVWVRYLMQALLSSVVLLPLHGRQVVRTAKLRLQLLRGVFLVGSSLLAVYSLTFMPLAEFTAIVMTTPLVVTVMAVAFLKERISTLHWVCVLGGFAGVLMIVRPGQHALGWLVVLPLGCTLANSCYQLLSSHLGKTERAATTHLYTSWVGTLVASLLLPLAWTAVNSVWLWTLMLLTGVMGAAGHFLLTLAYSRARAVTLVPYLYVHIGFSVIGGWLVFSQFPDAWSWAGITLIAITGIWGAWLSAREKTAIAQLPET